MKPAVVGMAEEYDHEVVFTPPYHSDLQPIEPLWAFIMGNIERQYSMSATLHRLRPEFEKLKSVEGSVLVRSMTYSIDKKILKFLVEGYEYDANESNFNRDTETEREVSFSGSEADLKSELSSANEEEVLRT